MKTRTLEEILTERNTLLLGYANVTEALLNAVRGDVAIYQRKNEPGR